MTAARNTGLAAALLAALAATLPPHAAAQEALTIPCRTDDKACIHDFMRTLPARTEAYWKPVLARPVEDRLGPAPRDLVVFLTLDNIAQGFPERPRPSRLEPPFLADVRGAIADLPPTVRRVLGATFAGVWFVDALGGTGYTDMFNDGRNRPVGGFIVLDAAVLDKFTANAWATWKENTPFKAGDGWTLQAKIEEPPGDNRRSAIRYILLHELGHVLSINRDLHPRWDMPPKEAHGGRRYPFFELSWTIDATANQYVSKFEEALPMRRQVAYYMQPKLAGADMQRTYDGLAKTNYPSLYAATSPGDDFAESFVTYVHTVLLKRPWQITLAKDGKVVKSYGTCWAEPRCASKRRILEGLLR